MSMSYYLETHSVGTDHRLSLTNYYFCAITIVSLSLSLSAGDQIDSTSRSTWVCHEIPHHCQLIHLMGSFVSAWLQMIRIRRLNLELRGSPLVQSVNDAQPYNAPRCLRKEITGACPANTEDLWGGRLPLRRNRIGFGEPFGANTKAA